MNEIGPTIVTEEEMERNFLAYIDRVERGGEHFVLTRNGEPFAEIVPVTKSLKHSELAQIKGPLPDSSPAVTKRPNNDSDRAVSEIGEAL